MNRRLEYERWDASGTFKRTGDQKFRILFDDGSDWLPRWEDLNGCFRAAARVESMNFPDDENAWLRVFQTTVLEIVTKVAPSHSVERLRAIATKHDDQKIWLRKRWYGEKFDNDQTQFPCNMSFTSDQLRHLIVEGHDHDFVVWDGAVTAVFPCGISDSCPFTTGTDTDV